MARANKKGKKQSVNGNKTGGSEKQENVQSPIKKTAGKKRKAKSEQGDSFFGKEVKKKGCYNLRSSNNSGEVRFVSEELCCQSEEERQKYEKLGLNTALFLSSAKPAKRKQSHISVITISSSDGEEMYYQRTADWVATMDVDSPGNLGEEDALPAVATSVPVDAPGTSLSGPVRIRSEDDSFNQHLSKLRVTTPTGSGFNPLFVSTPEQTRSGEERFDSFLTNPLPPKIQKEPSAASSEQVLQLQGNSSQFYFGNNPSVLLNDSSNTLDNSVPALGSSNLTGIHEMSSDLSGTVPLSESQEQWDLLARESHRVPPRSNSPLPKKSPKRKSSVKSNPQENH